MKMKRVLSIICLLAGCAASALAQQSGMTLGTSFSQPVPSAARSLFERAMAMSKAGKGELAQTLLKETLKIYPDYFDAHLALGNELFKSGRLQEAMTEFERARTINPKDDQVYLSVGLVMMQQKRYEVAAAIFTDASLLNPNEPLHPLMRGIALVRQAAAIKQSGSKNADAEGEALYKKAESALARASDLSAGKLPEVYLYRALIYERRGERERAALELEQYLQINPFVENAEAIREAIRKLRAPADRGVTTPTPQ
jgi:tetratricopeptide (TPR) repeat protein